MTRGAFKHTMTNSPIHTEPNRFSNFIIFFPSSIVLLLTMTRFGVAPSKELVSIPFDMEGLTLVTPAVLGLLQRISTYTGVLNTPRRRLPLSFTDFPVRPCKCNRTADSDGRHDGGRLRSFTGRQVTTAGMYVPRRSYHRLTVSFRNGAPR